VQGDTDQAEEVDMRSAVATWSLSVILAGPALGTTYVVNPDGTGDFPTIQAAVDAVVSGDIIELGNGVFTGDGNRDVGYLGKAITIRSQGGPEDCTIDCEGSAAEPHRGFSFVWLEGPESVLEGVTITHGYAEHGSAVDCFMPYTAPMISNCVFVDNGPGQSLGTGGAVEARGATPQVTDCIFINNSAAYGGAVRVCDSEDVVVFTRCTFAGNSAAWGGGIQI
jgi:hypothetical protein